jgi:hypothetical protein
MRAKKQTKKMLEEGGLLQEGGTVDPESGNDVPVGSLKEEVRDDIPAQLSEGEFVFPADVVRFIGLERLMQLRQEAKEGLAKMNAMGQMGNSEEATMEDDGEFETDIDDIMAEVEAESEGEGEDLEDQTLEAFDMAQETQMSKGGMSVKKQQGEPVKKFNIGGYVTKRYENEQGQAKYVPTINGVPQIQVPEGFTPSEKKISFGGVYREEPQAKKTASQQFEETFKQPAGVRQSSLTTQPPAQDPFRQIQAGNLSTPIQQPEPPTTAQASSPVPQMPGTPTAPSTTVQQPDTLTKLYSDAFGTNDLAKQKEQAAYYGLDLDEFKQIVLPQNYNELDYDALSNEVKTTGIKNVLTKAAETNPEAQIFKDNPMLLAAYRNPITESVEKNVEVKPGKVKAGTGQYEYYNNAPILNANVVNEVMGDSDKVGFKAFQKTGLADDLGWNFKSGEGLNFVQKGVSIVGLKKENYNDANLAALDQFKKPGVKGKLDTSSAAAGLGTSASNLTKKLEKAARSMGIDPMEFNSYTDLYRAVQKGTDGLYQVVGGYRDKKGLGVGWDQEQASGVIDKRTGVQDKGNHAGVMYREINGKLIAIDAPDLFNYNKPKGSIIGGTLGKVIREVSKVPFIAEASLLIPGVGPGIYAGIKAAQTAAHTSDFGKVATSAAMAYIPSQVLPGVADYTANALFQGGKGAITNAAVANAVGNAVTSSAFNGFIAALTKQDVGMAMAQGAISGGLMAGAQDLSNGIFGGRTRVIEIANNMGLKANQFDNILSGSLNAALIGSINDQDFMTTFTNNLITNGLSTRSANSVAAQLDQSMPAEQRDFIVRQTANIVGTATSAALNKQDAEEAIKRYVATGFVGDATQTGLGIARRAFT